MAQLEPALDPSEDPFHRPRPEQPLSVFVEGDTDKHKSFEIDCLLNKRIVRKSKGLATEYFVRWTGYGPEWDRWYNIKDLDNAADLVWAYEEGLAQQERWDFFVGGRLSQFYSYSFLIPIFFLSSAWFFYIIKPGSG